MGISDIYQQGDLVRYFWSGFYSKVDSLHVEMNHVPVSKVICLLWTFSIELVLKCVHILVLKVGHKNVGITWYQLGTHCCSSYLGCVPLKSKYLFPELLWEAQWQWFCCRSLGFLWIAHTSFDAWIQSECGMLVNKLPTSQVHYNVFWQNSWSSSTNLICVQSFLHDLILVTRGLMKWLKNWDFSLGPQVP